MVFTVGECVSKKWGSDPCWKWAILNMCLSAFNTLLWLFSLLKLNEVGRLGSIWCLLSAVIVIALGIFVFNEPLTTKRIIGFGLALVSMIFLLL
jgi:multidrug transporter EmrE-like cation transporter